jgi:hypothetical protein
MTTKTEANKKKPTIPNTKPVPKVPDPELDELVTRIDTLEKKVAALEAGIQQYLTIDNLVAKLTGSIVEKKVRKTRDYTDDERKAIRDRLEAGKMAKLKSMLVNKSTHIILDIQEPHETPK